MSKGYFYITWLDNSLLHKNCNKLAVYLYFDLLAYIFMDSTTKEYESLVKDLLFEYYKLL